jgi:OPA family glycerol-3-phosphate transporter-like MFS transporter
MKAIDSVVEPRMSRLQRWQATTVGYLVLGYAGYYLCRSNFSVSLPYITDELVASGMNSDRVMKQLGWITTLGTLAYAIGKFGGGALADALGGRRNMLLGMAGSVVFTWLFAGGWALWVFGIAWFGNRLLQSFGWPGMVKLASRWFSPSRYGTVMGILSLSFLFGDAASRYFMRWLFDLGLGWRGVFAVAGGVLGVLLMAGIWLLKESPESIGEKTPDSPSPEGSLPTPTPGDRGLPVFRLLSSPTFCLVCLLSFALTLVRETFNTWTPTYFVSAVGLGKAEAAGVSAVFPLAGGVSVLLAGWLADRLGRQGRMMFICVGLALGGAVLALLASGKFGESKTVPTALVMMAGFLLIGPYSYLAGAVSLDFGGREAGASASGLIDGVGYIGGMLAGIGFAELRINMGWNAAFAVLAGVTWSASLLAAVISIAGRREDRVVTT